MVSPSAKRRAVRASVEEGLGRAAQACRALSMARSTFYRAGCGSVESRRMHKEIVELTGWIALENYRSRFNAGLGLKSEGFSDSCEIPLRAAS